MTQAADDFLGPAPASPGAPSAVSADDFLGAPPAASLSHWYDPLASGLLLGQGPRIKALTQATKETIRGNPLGFGEVYDQALSQYQGASEEQRAEHPTAVAAGEAAGMVPSLLLGGGLVNAGLRAAGRAAPFIQPAVRFLTGEAGAALPAGSRNAAGQFISTAPMAGAKGLATRAASRTALMAREGAQAGAAGALEEGDDAAAGAGSGAEIGAGAGALAAPILSTVGSVARIPGAALSLVPPVARTIGGALGIERLMEYAPELYHLASANPTAAAAIAGAGATVGASRYLATNPAAREFVSRAGVAGASAFQGGPPPQGPSATDFLLSGDVGSALGAYHGAGP